MLDDAVAAQLARLDPTHLINRVKDRPTSSDITHIAKSHRRLASELVDDRRDALQPLRDLDPALLGLHPRPQSHVCLHEWRGVGSAEGDQDVDRRKVVSKVIRRLCLISGEPLPEDLPALVTCDFVGGGPGQLGMAEV
jgi:hypothetical protein